MYDLKQQKTKKVKQNRRKQEKQPRDWKKLLHRLLRITIATGTGFLLVCGALLTAQMLLESGYFTVHQLRVDHHSRVSEGDILEASDIKIGDSMFELDLHMIGRKIEEHPWISRAEVERSFPDQVVIRVIEREPRVIVDLGYLYYADAGGEIFKVLDHEDALDFAVVTGIDRQELLEHQDDARAWLNKALALVNELEQRTLFNLKDVSEIHFNEQDGLIVYTYLGGVPVHIGRGNFSTKLDRLERVYEDLEPRLGALAYIDLNVTDRVIVKVDVKRTIRRG
jgi:cell division protein FtsQ